MSHFTHAEVVVFCQQAKTTTFEQKAKAGEKREDARHVSSLNLRLLFAVSCMKICESCEKKNLALSQVQEVRG